jgi:hypothetical protein
MTPSFDVQIRVKISGFGQALECEPKPEKKCNYCGTIGHFKNRCPKLEAKKNIKKCKLCNGFECEKKNCKFSGKIREGIFKKPLSSLEASNAINERISQFKEKSSIIDTMSAPFIHVNTKRRKRNNLGKVSNVDNFPLLSKNSANITCKLNNEEEVIGQLPKTSIDKAVLDALSVNLAGNSNDSLSSNKFKILAMLNSENPMDLVTA